MFFYDDKGIKINGLDFWLDAHRKTSFSFVSHGHADHLKNHDKILATPITARFHAMRARQKESIVLNFNETLELDDLKIQLLPAGHVLGSAMILIKNDHSSLLYTGDFKLSDSKTSEPIKIPQADVLIMESTFGHPDYQFNNNIENVVDRLDDFIKQCFHQRITPIVLGYGLGKAQEAMKIIGELGYAVRVHKYAWQFAQVYQEFGVTFPNCAPWREGTLAMGEVLILPPHLYKTRHINNLPRSRRSVLLSGWSNGDNGFRYNSDEVLPLSDHADYNDLFTFVKKVNPQKIYTTHGFDEFPQHLCAAGFDAELLKPPQSTNN